MVYATPHTSQVSSLGARCDAGADFSYRLLFLYAGVQFAGKAIGISRGHFFEFGAGSGAREQSVDSHAPGTRTRDSVVRADHLPSLRRPDRTFGK